VSQLKLSVFSRLNWARYCKAYIISGELLIMNERWNEICPFTTGTQYSLKVWDSFLKEKAK
jgi:hypothetical protein